MLKKLKQLQKKKMKTLTYLFNKMLESSYTFLRSMLDRLEWVLRRVLRKDDAIQLSNKKTEHFQLKDPITDGKNEGYIMRIYRKKDTDEVVAYAVLWSKHEENEEISLFVDAQELESSFRRNIDG